VLFTLHQDDFPAAPFQDFFHKPPEGDGAIFPVFFRGSIRADFRSLLGCRSAFTGLRRRLFPVVFFGNPEQGNIGFFRLPLLFIRFRTASAGRTGAEFAPAAKDDGHVLSEVLLRPRQEGVGVSFGGEDFKAVRLVSGEGDGYPAVFYFNFSAGKCAVQKKVFPEEKFFEAGPVFRGEGHFLRRYHAGVLRNRIRGGNGSRSRRPGSGIGRGKKAPFLRRLLFPGFPLFLFLCGSSGTRLRNCRSRCG